MRAYSLCISAALFAVSLTACDAKQENQEATHTMRVVESYGEHAQRSVALDASWYVSGETSVEFAEVSLTLAPGEQPMVKKLETLLEETGFTWPLGGDTWPALARSAPPDALPMLSRLQLAMLLLYGAGDFKVDHPFVNLSLSPASIGTTRIERKGNKVTLHTIALVMNTDGGHLAWATSAGSFEKGSITLEGTRRIGNGTAERVQTTFTSLKSP